MSWWSKTVKKVSRHLKPKNLLSSIGSVLTGGTSQFLIEGTRGLYNEYKENEGLYNRMGAIIAGSILTGGVLGAASGAAGLAGMTTATGAASGAVSGAISGVAAGAGGAYQEKQMKDSLAEQERIAEEAERRSRRVAAGEALRQASNSPLEQSSLNIFAASRQSSQIKRTQVSRNKKVGGSTSTLG